MSYRRIQKVGAQGLRPLSGLQNEKGIKLPRSEDAGISEESTKELS
jgi:hypothetical protein